MEKNRIRKNILPWLLASDQPVNVIALESTQPEGVAMMRTLTKTVLLSVAMSMIAVMPAFADLITVDEFEKGSVDGKPIKGALGPDPGPGGLSSVLIYPLPFAGTQGDVKLLEPGGIFFDLVR